MKYLNEIYILGALLVVAGSVSVSCSSNTGSGGTLPGGSAGGSDATGGVTGTGTGGVKSTSAGGSIGTNTGGSQSATGGTVAVITGPAVLCVQGAKLATDYVIDDCNDNNNQIHPADSRTGYWYTFNDGTTGATAQTPGASAVTPMTAPGYDGTGYAFYTTGAGYSTWGAGFGFSFVNGGGTLMCPYDASAATGISFYYKSDVALRLVIRMRSTIPIADHGECNVGNSCNNPHGVAIPAAAAWTKKSVLWSELAVDPNWGWAKDDAGTPPAFNAAALADMQFKIPAATATVSAFNVSVDQLEFTK